MHVCFQEFMKKNANTFWKLKMQQMIEGVSYFIKMGGRSSKPETGR